MSNLMLSIADNEPPAPQGTGSELRALMICGGTDGIGFSLLASELLRSKYTHFFVLGRDFSRVRRLRRGTDDEIPQQASQKIVEIPCDITSLDEIGIAVDKIEDNSLHDFVLTIGTFSSGKIADILPITSEENDDKKQSPGNSNDVVADHFHLNCVSTIHLIRSILPKLVEGDSQILTCTASLALKARSPYGLQSATKAALRSFVDTLRIELAGKTRIMNLMPPSVDTKIFAKAGDSRRTDGYPPPSRIANTMQFMLDCPPDICIPEMLIEQHHFEGRHHDK